MKNIIHFERATRDGESCLDQNIRKMPMTDWNFHAAGASFRGGSSGQRRNSLRALRAMGESYFGDEAKREDRIEGAVFGAIAALTVGPIAMAAHAIFGLIN